MILKCKILALIVVPAGSSFAEKPAKLIELNKQFDEAVERAKAPIEKQYLAALVRLQKSYTKKGELMAALEVKKQYEDFLKKASPVKKSKDESPLFVRRKLGEGNSVEIVGTWRWSQTSQQGALFTGSRTFAKDGSHQWNGQKDGKWWVENNQLYLSISDNTEVAKFQLPLRSSKNTGLIQNVKSKGDTGIRVEITKVK